MFSEALKIMDRNTVRYMMDEMQKELSDTKSELSDKEAELSDMKSKLSHKETELNKKESQLISTIIQMTKEYSGTKEQAIAKIIDKCGKTETEAKELVEKYW